MGRKTEYRNFARGLALNAESTAHLEELQKLENIWLEMLSSFFHHTKNKEQILRIIGALLDAVWEPVCQSHL